MQKFINHVDHVAWIVRPENLDMHIEQLEKLTGATLTRFSRADMGFIMCISWEAGLEVVAPMEERTEFNTWLWSELETKGEGVTSVVFGVRDLDWHNQRLAKMGIEAGTLMDDHPSSPWHDKLVLWERVAGQAINTNIVLGDIDYQDGLIPFGPSDRPHSND
jgi:hypothetical protein